MSPSDECRGASAHGEERVSRVRGWEGGMDKVAIYIYCLHALPAITGRGGSNE